MLLGIGNEIVWPGSAPSGTRIITVSSVPGIENWSFMPGFTFGGTSSSNKSPSMASSVCPSNSALIAISTDLARALGPCVAFASVNAPTTSLTVSSRIIELGGSCWSSR